MLSGYDDVAIRRNALGEFCQLLKAVVVHAVMVRYLNNEKNVAGRINENHARSNGDIAETLKTLLTSAEFAQGTGRKLKDPIRYVISVVRLAYDEKPIINTTPVINWLNRMREPLYSRRTPDGYPLQDTAQSPEPTAPPQSNNVLC